MTEQGIALKRGKGYEIFERCRMKPSASGLLIKAPGVTVLSHGVGCPCAYCVPSVFRSDDIAVADLVIKVSEQAIG
jgi:hypothetical protein